MNNRLIDAPVLPKKFIKKYGFQYFTEGENKDYLADELLGIHTSEETAICTAGETAFELLKRAARKIAFDASLLSQCGIPETAGELLRWSMDNEEHDFLIGRFDFAGGLEGQPVKLLEFNADTCSLLIETAFLQPEILKTARKEGVRNELLESLAENIRRIDRNSEQHLLLTDLGFPEDQLSASVIGRAAQQAGITDLMSRPLEELIFEPNDAVLIDIGAGQAKAYGLAYKAFPWDFILFEEPELWDILSELIMNGHIKMLNPAWSMLMQCKGVLAVAWQENPNHPLLLETTWSKETLRSRQFVQKPIWGRMGENVSMFHSPNYPTATTEGDYADSPMIYQQLANFSQDADEHRYQVSSFYTNRSCAISVRRQDDLIMDDDAEFVSSFRL